MANTLLTPRPVAERATQPHRQAASVVSGEPAVRVEGLCKDYGNRRAVNSLSIELPKGVVAGFVGPNGAGKTTTMAMLLGLVKPSGGDAQILGESISNPSAYLGRVGALIESPAFYKGLSGRRNLEVLAAVAGQGGHDIPQLLDALGLGSRGEDSFRSYSHGMKQRLGIAGALLGDPELLLLDEPTNGLDPEGIREIRELVAGLANEKRTVLVSSHALAELEQVANWLIIIDKGSVLFQGTPAQLQGDGSRVALAAEEAHDLGRLQDVLIGAGHRAEVRSHEVVVTVPASESRREAANLNRLAASHDITLSEIRVVRRTLEQCYFDLLKGEAA